MRGPGLESGEPGHPPRPGFRRQGPGKVQAASIRQPGPGGHPAPSRPGRPAAAPIQPVFTETRTSRGSSDGPDRFLLFQMQTKGSRELAEEQGQQDLQQTVAGSWSPGPACDQPCAALPARGPSMRSQGRRAHARGWRAKRVRRGAAGAHAHDPWGPRPTGVPTHMKPAAG